MSRVLSNASASDRPDTDFYPTPQSVTEALLDFVDFPPDTIFWEPVCGKGAISRVLIQDGFEVYSSDIRHTGYGDGGVDFRTAVKPDGVNFILTNPPFNVSGDFIEHAATMDGIRGFAFLLKSQAWHGRRRFELFRKYRPAFVLPLTWRPDFLFGTKSGSPTMEVLWTVWSKPFATITEYQPLIRPDRVDGSLFAGGRNEQT